METYRATIETPVGALRLTATDAGLAKVEFAGQESAASATQPVLAQAAEQLRTYFAGQRTAFDVRTAAAGTDFQQAVWRALAAIPFGETRSYGEIARAVGRPRAARAVGMACRTNPLAIIVPCHRVVGGSGGLTGYAGGLPNKKLLLALEGIS